MWQCQEAFFVVTIGIWWVEVRVAAQHPTEHKTAPQQSMTRPKVKADKPCLIWSFLPGNDFTLRDPCDDIGPTQISQDPLVSLSGSNHACKIPFDYNILTGSGVISQASFFGGGRGSLFCLPQPYHRKSLFVNPKWKTPVLYPSVSNTALCTEVMCIDLCIDCCSSVFLVNYIPFHTFVPRSVWGTFQYLGNLAFNIEEWIQRPRNDRWAVIFLNVYCNCF